MPHEYELKLITLILEYLHCNELQYFLTYDRQYHKNVSWVEFFVMKSPGTGRWRCIAKFPPSTYQQCNIDLPPLVDSHFYERALISKI